MELCFPQAGPNQTISGAQDDKETQHSDPTETERGERVSQRREIQKEMMMGRGGRDREERDEEEGKGLLWKLPVIKSPQLGKVGPAFGVGVGCGLGFGVGLLGGLGFGPGIPGLQVGFGLGAGCGVGLGFGYGVGKGIAHDDHRRYSNVGNLFQGANVGISRASGNLPTQDDIGALVEELVDNTKKLVRATTREMDKWRR